MHSYHGDVCALIPKSGVIPGQINERPRPYLHPHLETGIWTSLNRKAGIREISKE